MPWKIKMNNKKARQFLKFIYAIENVKKVTRHCFTSKPRVQESVADHSWRMAMIAIILAPEISKKINMEKLLKMILVHDLPEAITGDYPCFMQTPAIKKKKHKEELQAISKFRKMLPEKIGKEIFDLFIEYEERKTLEAKIAKVLDGQEVKIQHYEEGVKHWHPKEKGLYTINAGDQNLNFPEAEKIRPLIELIRSELIDQHKKNKIEIK